MVTYIRSDLDFILAQIKLAEAHAAGQPLYGPGGLLATYNLAFGLRAVDGSNNHVLPGQERWGASDQPFFELMTPEYRPADGTPFDPDGPGPAPAMPTSPNYNPSNNPNSLVFDASLRTISNLLVDQTLANPAAILTALQNAGVDDPAMLITASISAAYAPLKPLFKTLGEAERAEAEAAAAAAASPGNVALQDAANAAALVLAAAQAAVDAAAGVPGGLYELLSTNGVELDGVNVYIPNFAPDEGLSAPFNSWFTLFGQFFDHGLDLVNKGGSGTVFVPLQPDDPLYVVGSHTNFMVLTRATVTAGVDGIMNTADDVRPLNTTTPFVDQNQTYTSHASHQVFLREYAVGTDGKPHATGNLIEGANGGMATWGELKAKALMLGIQLTDADVGKVPLLRTDAYGNFIPNAAGYAQVITGVGGDGIPNTADDVVISGTPGSPVSLLTAIRTNAAFLADIAHNAVPDGLADGDITIGLNNPGFDPGAYDNELLDAHFIAGDGRVNENIGLTAVHHVFHAEHNRLVEHTKDVALADAQAMLAGGATQAQAVAFLNEWLDVDVATVPASTAGLVWDGERLFQAAKFGNEMQYQHLVFEEFARKIQPTINTFLVPDGFDTMMDPSIFAEFAHVVYRFGHSMLTESIDQFDPTFNANHISLIQGFLNPTAFTSVNGVDDGIAAGAIIRGMTRQVGNEIDEFVTSALRNNLLGLPLDLATINLARGRDTGVPSLNEARRTFFEATNEDSRLKPYESWVDYAAHLKHEASIINFIAAYGTHSLITGQTTIEGKRDAALTIITGTSVGGLLVPADAEDFLNGVGAYAGDLGGLENVDLWIGGLAEEVMPFGGMLGATFNFVFEVQMEQLQSGDRFYYLQRLDGLHLFGEMEGNSFASMIMRNTNATHLPSDVFSTPGLILEVDQARQFNDLDGDGDLESDDPLGGGLLTDLVIRGANSLRYTGGDHVVMGGTEAGDTITAGIGDDTIFGDGGNDRLEGGFGNDIINGGDGDDIIKDSGGDDNIKAGNGNDVVHAGPGLDLVMGGAGQDFIFLGTDMGSEVFAGEGNDFIYGNRNAERILGNEGNDWIETGTFDGAPGDNFDEIFAHDGIDGHDVFLGDGGFDEFIGEGGDDIMVGSSGRGKMAGMSGFDWATYKDNGFGVNADLSIPIVFDEAPTLPANASLDEYASMEGLSGTRYNDVLAGSNILADERLPFNPAVPGSGLEGYRGSQLTKESLQLITGLRDVFGLTAAQVNAMAAGTVVFSNGDVILGGDGNDRITGRAGDDMIDGDKWLDVQIQITGPRPAGVAEFHNSMTTLATHMFSGAINPGQLQIVRTIKTDTTNTGAADPLKNIDTAVFSDVRSAYTITHFSDGRTTVAHTNPTPDLDLESDGVDTLRNIERIAFGDGIVINIAQDHVGEITINDATPTEGQQLTSSTAGIVDPDGLGPISRQWQSSFDGLNWTNIAGATGVNFTPTDLAGILFGPQADLQLRVVATWVDGSGVTEVSVSDPTSPTGVDWDGTGGVNTLNGTRGDDVADAGGGNDILFGNDGADDLDGDGGNDTITGGNGDDLITGDTGTDTAVFTGPVSNYDFDLVGGNLTVTDNAGVDDVDTLLTIENLQFGAQVLTLVQGTDGNNGNINGNNSAVGDLVLGYLGNDNLDPGTGNDVADGGGGNDTIEWNANNAAGGNNTNSDGRDIVRGGAGTDTYEVNGNNNSETYRLYTRAAAITAGITDLAADTEIVVTRAGANNASIIGELSGIEEIVINSAGGGGDAFQVFGDFTGTSLDLNTITINGSWGDDAVDISGLTSAHRIVFNSGGGYDSFVGQRLQDLMLMDDAIFGSDEADVIYGGAGSDIFFGGAGADFMAGGEGSDTYIVADAVDVVEELAGEGDADYVLSEVSYRLAADAHVEILSTTSNAGTAAINLAGSDSANVIYGNEGANVLEGLGGDDNILGLGGADMLIGGAGADYLAGGAGDDTYIVSEAADVIAEASGEGRDYVLSDVSYRLAAGAVVEILSTTSNAGTAAIDLAGSDSANIVYGNEGSNVLEGLGGDDNILGLGGADMLVGGAGADYLAGGRDDDTYIVSDAADVVAEASGEGRDYVLSDVSYRLAAGAEVEILSTTNNAGTAAIDLAGSDSANVIYGNDGSNVLEGLGGADYLLGLGGDDRLSGGAGDDWISGDGGEDTAVLSGSRSSYTFVDLGGGAYRVTDSVSGRDGVDYLTAVERVEFGDGTSASLVDLASATSGASSMSSTMISSQMISELSDEDGQGFLWEPLGGSRFSPASGPDLGGLSNNYIAVSRSDFDVEMSNPRGEIVSISDFGGDDFILGSASSLRGTMGFSGELVEAFASSGFEMPARSPMNDWALQLELFDGSDDFQNPTDDYFLL